MKSYIVSCLIILTNLSVFCDEFWIFNVGQGNCQLAVYEKERIGILYDCGSSSWKTCTKLSALHAEKYELFFQKKDKAGSPNKTSGQPAPLDVFSILEEEGNTPEEILSDGSVGSFFSQDDKSDIDDIDLNSILKKLNHVFIILSHPDRDHINLVNTENIPDGIPMTFLCEGDWFGQKNKKGDRLTEDVCAVLNFLRSRANTYIDFPFYWNGLQEIGGYKSYKEFLQIFESDDNTFSKTFAFCNTRSVIAKMECLSLQDTLKEMIKRSPDKEKVIGHLRSSVLDEGCSLAEKLTYPIVIFSEPFVNVKIAHINFPFKEVNSQSAIVEIKMPKLDMQFFLTGDASEETFTRLAENSKDFFKKEYGYTSFVMLPHHGSKENKSTHMFNIFKPDIFGISAGNGGMFDHPSKELIDEIQGKYKESSFFEKFVPIGEKNTFLAFHSGKSHLIEGSMPPFICTNTLGSVKISEEGFLCSFSSQIEIGAQIFQINYKHSVQIDGKPEPMEGTEHVFKCGEQWYYFLNGKYYLLQPIESHE